MLTNTEERFYQSDVLWMIAFISILFSFFYDIYLFKKLSRDLDVCDFYHQKDQITYDNIIKDRKYRHWKDQRDFSNSSMR